MKPKKRTEREGEERRRSQMLQEIIRCGGGCARWQSNINETQNKAAESAQDGKRWRPSHSGDGRAVLRKLSRVRERSREKAERKRRDRERE